MIEFCWFVFREFFCFLALTPLTRASLSDFGYTRCTVCSMTDSSTLTTASASLRLSRWVLRYSLLSWLPSVAKPRGGRGGGGTGDSSSARHVSGFRSESWAEMDESGSIMILATPISSRGREECTPLFGLDGCMPQGMVLWVLSIKQGLKFHYLACWAGCLFGPEVFKRV